MEFKKIIFVITGLLFLMRVPATPGRIHLTPEEPTEGTVSIHIFELNRNAIFLAENESEAAENESPSTTEKKEQSSESGAAVKENSSNSVNDAETDPIKPFKPSEEIAAEQAVDFPVDI